MNVRFYTIEKIEKQSLKTLFSSLGDGILNADYSGLCLFFFFLSPFHTKLYHVPLALKAVTKKSQKWTFPVFPWGASRVFTTTISIEKQKQ